MHKPLLIFDIDETLVRAESPAVGQDCEFSVCGYNVSVRPWAEHLIKSVSPYYDLAIWTSGGSIYASAIVKKLFDKPEDLKFVWSSSRCKMKYDCELLEHCSTKPLKKVSKIGYFLERVLVVDDSPEKHRSNYGNLIRVAPYLGGFEDSELKDLAKYLIEIKDIPNFRKLEKRGWRRHLQ